MLKKKLFLIFPVENFGVHRLKANIYSLYNN